MLRIAIVDDDKIFISYLTEIIKTELEQHDTTYHIDLFADSKQFLNIYQKENYQLVFLDIDMPDISGIEIAADIRKFHSDTTLIFVSSYENFVFESIRYKPFRFIRKEYLQSEVNEAIKAYFEELLAQHKHIEFHLENSETAKFITSEIVFIYSVRHDLYIYDKEKNSFRLAYRHYTIKELEKQLKEHGFLRVDNSYLLNFRYIYQLQTYKAILLAEVSKNEHDEIPISRRRYSNVREQYQILLRGVDAL